MIKIIAFLFFTTLFSCSTYPRKYDKIKNYIDCIDVDKKSFIGYPDLNSSYIGPSYFGYIGINYACYIEYLIKNEQVDIDSVESYVNNEYMHEKFTGKGLIIKVQDNKVIDTLSLSDMKYIKSLYSDWWSKNKCLSRKELKKEYEKNPILRQPYEWR